MSVSFATAVAAGLRAHGITVHYWNGWERRGNGQTSDYRGMVWHHTATAFGSAPAILVNGRSDLSGPLCNSSGNADGSVTIIAANPANHAGASGGRSMGPLPVTRSFNKHVWGHEIVYPGTEPMRPAQMRTALILAGVICGILKRPNPEWARQHAETSITGKWDPGYAPGKTYSGSKMRADIWGALNSVSAKPSPVAPITVQKRVQPMIIERPLVTGSNYGRIICPVGTASQLYKSAWVSVTANGGGSLDGVCFQKDGTGSGPAPGAGAKWTGAFSNADRVWKPVPSGTEFIEYWITANGAGTLAVEMDPA